ncbi:MAG TPA: hypothetical protein EYP28_02870 [Methanophagales archaeon]|nr:hypothetical protein [Methanophagales archaeon]
MKRRMKAGLLIVIVAVMVFSSYAGAVAFSPEELRDLALANATEIDTYKFDMNMSMRMRMGNGTNVTGMTMEGNGSSMVDTINKSMWTAMRMCMNVSEIMDENTDMNTTENASLDVPETTCMGIEMYVINNSMYTKMDPGSVLPFNTSLWIKTNMSEEDWVSEDQLEQQMALLKASNVELLGDEVVKGVDCYVVKIDLDSEMFWELMLNQLLMNQPEMDEVLQNVSDIANQSMINISMTQWIAKATKFVMKSKATMEMAINPDTGEESKVRMDYEMDLYDYNVPVTIVLPPEAERSFDIDDLLGMLPGINRIDIPPGANQTAS